MSWDLTAVLVAVKGYEPYYNVERGTFRVVNDEGANSWTPDGKGRDLRLIEKVPAAEMAVLIENYMMLNLSQNKKVMFIVQDYSLAILFCVVTMLCWGSWGNDTKAGLEDLAV